MKTRKVPLRTCVVTKETKPKRELIRIVRTPNQEVLIDKTGKANGRGAYLSLKKDVIIAAKKSKALEKKLEVVIPDYIYDELLNLTDE